MKTLSIPLGNTINAAVGFGDCERLCIFAFNNMTSYKKLL